MAKEEVPEAAVEVPKRKGKLLIIIIAVVAVLVIGGGVGAYFLMSKPAAEEGAKQEEEHADEEHPPIYEKLESFTVNLADQQYYLQVEEMTLLVENPEVQEKIKTRLPEVRDALFRLLSSKTAEELFDKEGKDKLAEEIRKEVNGILHIKGDAPGVKKVLFPKNFILQES
jgi:flagellar FliL protein